MCDYTAGKQDWAAAGLPVEGREARKPRAGDVARPDVPTCGLNDLVRDAGERASASGWPGCVVVNEERIVLGLLGNEELGGDPERRAEEVMRPGPSTFRPNVPIAEMAQHMIEHDLQSAPITTSEGRLVGMLRREDAAGAALELHRREHGEHAGEGYEDG